MTLIFDVGSTSKEKHGRMCSFWIQFEPDLPLQGLVDREVIAEAVHEVVRMPSAQTLRIDVVETQRLGISQQSSPQDVR